MLLNQAHPWSRAKVTVGMERTTKCKHVLVTWPLVSFTHFLCGPPTPLTDMPGTELFPFGVRLFMTGDCWSCRPLSWTSEAVWCSQGACWRHQAASVIWASPGVKRPDAWQINCWYRISHVHFTCTPTPSVCVSLSHDLQWGSLPAYGLSDRRGWPDRRRRLLSAQYWARLLRKVLGRYQYHPILASIGQYPIPQYWYRSNPIFLTGSGICCCQLLNGKRHVEVWLPPTELLEQGMKVII